MPPSRKKKKKQPQAILYPRFVKFSFYIVPFSKPYRQSAILDQICHFVPFLHIVFEGTPSSAVYFQTWKWVRTALAHWGAKLLQMVLMCQSMWAWLILRLWLLDIKVVLASTYKVRAVPKLSHGVPAHNTLIGLFIKPHPLRTESDIFGGGGLIFTQFLLEATISRNQCFQ